MNVHVDTTAATVAAAQGNQQMCHEEEELTHYSREDLTDDWEFKILRSVTNGFRKPEKLRHALEEEARAGWVLVEKFDDNRLRLKRPADAKRNDRALGIDPYRTYVGMNQERLALLILFFSLGFVALIICLIYALK